ncbi:MAG: DUF2325 domain-containing protein [Desulfurivibrionaceae bacterium]
MRSSNQDASHFISKENKNSKKQLEHYKAAEESAWTQKLKEMEDQIRVLRQDNAVLLGRIDELTGDLEASHDLLEQSSRIADDLEKRNAVLSTEKEELRQEVVSLETASFAKMATSSRCSGCEDKDTEGCPGPGLCGKTILYVGGQHKMVPHYKQLVEKYGGRFIHHDGGREASRARLPKMLDSADAVVCPVGCVSHDACNQVKKICKRCHKPFVMMRSSGLSSLAKGLNDII